MEYSGSMAPTPTALGLDPRLEGAGFNAAGALPTQRYDALVPPAWRAERLLPGARSAALLGCGGRAFGEAVARSPCAEPHPIDRFTRRAVEAAVGVLERRGARGRALFYWERRDGEFADFVALGRACGLGEPGRLGVLLHPHYGPWFSIRALILTSAELQQTGPLRDFAPCEGCPAPCEAACPGGAVRAEGFDAGACARTSEARPGCRERCDARRACVVGREHRYPDALERRFRRAALALLSRGERG